MEFEWDPDKAEKNFGKHNIEFEAAKKVFEAPFVQELDEYDPDDAVRYNAVGYSEGRLLYVTYTMRGNVLPHHISQTGGTT